MKLLKQFPREILVISFCSWLSIVVISFFKVALELEDAEQAYYTQWFRLGYDDQPPLYTWLQLLINKSIGLHKISLSGLRGLCFSGTLLMMYKLALKLHQKRKLAIVTVYLLVLIPVFIDFNFRRLSHTSLLCFLMVSLHLVFLNMTSRKKIKDYILFGILFACATLTKYNFLLVAPVFLVVPFFDEKAKTALLNKRVFWSLSVYMLLIVPHLYWLLNNLEAFTNMKQSMEHKTAMDTVGNIIVLTPFWTMAKAFFKLMFPGLIVLGVFIFLKRIKVKSVKFHLIMKMLLIQIITVFLIFMTMNVSKVSERWLLPIFLPFWPLLISFFRFKNIKTWQIWGFRIFMLVLLVQLIRTPAEKLMGVDSSVHHSFAPVIKKLETYSDKTWYLPDVTYAGSVHFERPDRKVLAADDFTLPPTAIDSANTVFVRKQKITGLKLKDSITNFGYDKDTLYFYEK